ncbi:MAG: DegT/DnrJ/EryC1/StrS family aminotransferase [Thermotogae bacterium]|nr:DegT/DnrJ/EryC1/StrS family aminotransferase [Thermotogota bacterium]
MKVPPDYPGAVMIDEEEIQSVVEVLKAKSPFRFYGPSLLGKTKSFEEKFAEFVGVKHALAVSSGTAALVVSLRALGIGEGDEVIVPANTFIASAGAVLESGATPVYAEVDESLTIDVNKIEERITPKTKALMVVHFAGVPCKMNDVLEIVKEHGLILIEDCAQACGASFNGKKVGSFGDIGAFSFQINKIITTGDGGAITTNDEKIYQRAVRAHDQGCLRDENGHLHIEISNEAFYSSNYRMTELAAAVGIVQLAKIDRIISAMRENKKKIVERLGSLKNYSFAKIWDEDGDTGRNLILIAQNVSQAKCLTDNLSKLGFAAAVPYEGLPVYANKQIRDMKDWKGRTKDIDKFKPCPYTENLLPRTVIIGINPLFEEDHIDTLVKIIRECDES